MGLVAALWFQGLVQWITEKSPLQQAMLSELGQEAVFCIDSRGLDVHSPHVAILIVVASELLIIL